MKIAIHSDLHTESHADGGRTLIGELPHADILIMAGDVANGPGLLPIFDMVCAKYEHVIYVIGNHDLWGYSFAKVREVLGRASAKHPNLHALDNRVATIDGVRFVGATMFFPYEPLNDLKESHMVDFQLVENFRNEVYNENEFATSFLYGQTQPGDIVITHHMPHERSVHPMFANDALNCFFLCDMSGMIRSRRPAIWIHGHTHFSFDYMVDDTRIICNPFGYSFAVNPGFDAKKSLEIG